MSNIYHNAISEFFMNLFFYITGHSLRQTHPCIEESDQALPQRICILSQLCCSTIVYV